MKTKFFINILFIALLGFNACSTNSKSGDKSTQTSTEVKKTVYRCPMDTDVVSDKPGTCSKCGMDLVKDDK